MAVTEERRRIGARLRISRLAAKLSLADCGNAVRRSRQAVAGWEAGRSMPDAEQLGHLCRLYGVSADYIVLGIKTSPVGGRMLEEIFREQDAQQSDWPEEP